METFAASSAKLFVENLYQRDKLHPISFLWCHSQSNTHTPTPRETADAALVLKKHRHHAFNRSSSLLSVSLHHRKAILPVSSATALPASEPQSLAGDEGIHTKDTTNSNTVHVKFQLRRECSFGQQFLMVGDDPMFGLWDPLNAIPLNWSEGHVWAVEMDIPCDKAIKYKFILKGGDDTILWQPGPDRILQTWETKKTITVCEDWDNAGLQTIMEEEPVSHQLSESTEVSQVLKESENLLQPNRDPESFIKMEITTKNAYSKPNKAMLAENPIAAVAENITEQNGEKKVEANGFPAAELTPNADKVAVLEIMDYPNTGRSSSIEINLDSGAAVPVLVPGLTPMPLAETEEPEASISRAEKHINTDSSLKSLNVPEPHLKEEPGIELPIPKEETENWLDDKLELPEKEHEQVQEPQLFEEKELPEKRGMEDTVEDGVLKNDIQWGRRTLQQFLVSLGLL